MRFFLDLLEMLAFRARALRAQAARRSVSVALALFAAGFLLFVLVRNAVYSGLQEDALAGSGILDSIFRLNVLQALLFLSFVYIPAIICLGNSVAGFGFSMSRDEFRMHLSALLPLWGVLLLIAAPLQRLLPQFLVIGIFGISIGLAVLSVLTLTYTVWAIRELNYLSTAAAFGIFSLSWATLPVFYVLTGFFFALPLFIMIPLLYLALQRARAFAAGRSNEREFQRHLRTLTMNPQDADAHHQLGLIQLNRGNLEMARECFTNALKIDSNDPDYHYFLGRVYETTGDWENALDHYEETYRLNPEYGLRDIFREVGKAYLQTEKLEKAKEFLHFFLQSRGSDPEGRYWLAVAMQRSGDLQEMRVQVNTILEQARSNPRFFTKERREWIHRARALLRS